MHVIDAGTIARRGFGETQLRQAGGDVSTLCAFFACRSCKSRPSGRCTSFTVSVFAWEGMRYQVTLRRTRHGSYRTRDTERFTDVIPLSGSEEACQLCTVSQPA